MFATKSKVVDYVMRIVTEDDYTTVHRSKRGAYIVKRRTLIATVEPTYITIEVGQHFTMFKYDDNPVYDYLEANYDKV